jgi:hypothetical protein
LHSAHATNVLGDAIAVLTGLATLTTLTTLTVDLQFHFSSFPYFPAVNTERALKNLVNLVNPLFSNKEGQVSKVPCYTVMQKNHKRKEESI